MGISEYRPGSAAGFVLSLDLELMWGVRASQSIETYGANVLGVRRAVPRLLELFGRYDIGCTWAAVGLLFFEERDALMAALPDIRPSFRDARLSSYADLAAIGPDEASDPFHYGLSLIRRIAECPRQEIGTHTFAHYFCLEQDFDAAAFGADIDAAIAAAAPHGIRPRSIVFPRNQVVDEALEICAAKGIAIHRGAGANWFDRPSARRGESILRRGSRLASSYLPAARPGAGRIGATARDGRIDVPASRFLRPHSLRAPYATALQIKAVTREMRRAAWAGQLFHLWFHPHNFGVNLDANMAMLNAIVTEAARLRDAYGWPSLTMEEAGAAAGQLGTVGRCA